MAQQQRKERQRTEHNKDFLNLIFSCNCKFSQCPIQSISEQQHKGGQHFWQPVLSRSYRAVRVQLHHCHNLNSTSKRFSAGNNCWRCTGTNPSTNCLRCPPDPPAVTQSHQHPSLQTSKDSAHFNSLATPAEVAAEPSPPRLPRSTVGLQLKPGCQDVLT